MSIEQRLAELGITLPQPAAPVASYVPAVEQTACSTSPARSASPRTAA